MTILFPSMLFSAQGWYLKIFPRCVSTRWSALDTQVCIVVVPVKLPKSPLNQGWISAFGPLICKVKSQLQCYFWTLYSCHRFIMGESQGAPFATKKPHLDRLGLSYQILGVCNGVVGREHSQNSRWGGKKNTRNGDGDIIRGCFKPSA